MLWGWEEEPLRLEGGRKLLDWEGECWGWEVLGRESPEVERNKILGL